MRTYFPWNSEDIFLKNRGKVVCDTTENERESTIPLLNMDISNLSDGKSEDGVAKSKHVNGLTSPSAQSVKFFISSSHLDWFTQVEYMLIEQSS